MESKDKDTKDPQSLQEDSIVETFAVGPFLEIVGRERWKEVLKDTTVVGFED